SIGRVEVHCLRFKGGLAVIARVSVVSMPIIASSANEEDMRRTVRRNQTIPVVRIVYAGVAVGIIERDVIAGEIVVKAVVPAPGITGADKVAVHQLLAIPGI